MCVTAFLAAASVAGSAMQAGAASRAARAQERASDSQIDLYRDIYDETTERFQPFLGAGENALAAYRSELGLGAAPEGYQGFQATPGYQFRLQQGQDTVEGSAASRGGLFSGQTLQDLTKFGQGIASQEYGGYMNRLAGLASSGQAAAGNLASAGQQYGSGAGTALANIGNAQAAGSIGVGNAISGGLGNIASILQYQNTLNQLSQPSLSGGGIPGQGGLY